MDSGEITVLYVEPTGDVRKETVDAIEEEPDMDAHTAATKQEGLSVAEDHPVDCVVAAYDLPQGTAFELFESIREDHPGAACILFSEVGVSELGSGSVGDVIVEYLSKDTPDAEQRLTSLIRSVVTNRMQVGYPVPDKEDDRLNAVEEHDLPGLSTTATFDRITRLIMNHFDIDVAFVGLMKEHEEEFVSCYGAAWSKLAREDSVCTHAMLEEGVTVIENVQEDPRFEYNDRLRELGVRAYAGANLETMDGHVIGELCLISHEPRSFTDGELVDLQLFADEVMEQLELRRRLPETDAGVTIGE